MTSWDASVSVIIPTRNEAQCIAQTVSSARSRAGASQQLEILVVDGGSTDGTVDAARNAGANVLVVPGGRAAQLNAGATAAAGFTLFFLHADATPPQDYCETLRSILEMPGTVAGAFRLRVASNLFGIRMVQGIANIRASYLQLPYGDQGLFIKRSTFHAVGGYPELPFMDDYAMSRKLSRLGRIQIADEVVEASGRRWETLGVLPTTVINQLIIVGYRIGIPVTTLQSWYYGAASLARSGHRNASKRITGD
jgi:uncharacterized protein